VGVKSRENWTRYTAIGFALSLQLFSLESVNAQQALSYTDAQADAGAQDYASQCAACHGANLQGIGVVPSVAGQGFLSKWSGAEAAELYDQLSRMPPQNPGGLSETSYTNILAFILQSNAIASEATPLPSGRNGLANLLLPDQSEDPFGNVLTELERTGSSQLLDNLRPVTNDMLNSPPAGDWISWHYSHDSHGFSPLDQVDRNSVSRLGEVWRLSLPAGNNNPTPLIHDGVMFFYTFPDTVMAIDAGSGTVLWRYSHDSSIPSTRKMGIALHENKVIVPTSDMRMLALNAQTGGLIWNKSIDTQLEVVRDVAAYDLRAAPLIAGDKIIQGVTGSMVSTGAFIVALHAETGEEAWRFYTLARPGEPGGDTWNDLPLEERRGGSVWIHGSYDPELNLAYFGIAPTYHTQSLTYSVNIDGVSNDALYTNATVALNADTGELAWHYQHMPNDQWDLDWVFERLLVNLDIDGEPRRAVMNVGKSAILEANDAATGEYLFSVDMGLQNIITAIDPVTGEKTINPDTFPRREGAYNICPNAVGARSWPPSGYNPQSKRLYVPLVEGCFKAGSEGNELLLTGIPVQLQAHPASDDGNMGRLQVIDLESRQLAWRHRQQTPIISSVLATAGGLVFTGDLDPSLKAFDEATGDILWQSPLSDAPSAGIVTFAVEGRQYIAVVVGQSNNHVRDWSGMSQAYAAIEGWDVETPPPGQGAAIVVFALRAL